MSTPLSTGWLLIIAAIGCGPAEPPQTAAAPAGPTAADDAPGDAAPEALPGGWKRFVYDAGASVLTPAQPEVVEDTEAYLASADGVGYFLTCDDVPGENTEGVKELLARAKAIRLAGRTAAAERDVSRDGMEGLFFETTTVTADGTKLAEHNLVMIRGKRGCFLAVLAPEGVDVTANKTRYFESLRMAP